MNLIRTLCVINLSHKMEPIMKKLQIVFVLVLSLIIVSSNASENEKKVSSECPYISKIHSTVSLDKAKSECPYLSNKSNASNNCPYSKNEKI